MASLQQNLLRARLDLLDAQANLALMRKVSAKNKFPLFTAERACERLFLRAIDRAWEAQCMAEGTFHA